MNTKDIVSGYYQAWTTRNIPAARALLADDFLFDGPIDRFTNPDDLMTAIGGLMNMVTEARLLAEFYAGDEGMLLYDLVTPTPAGTIRTAEHFTVKDGRITGIKLVFDAGPLRAMMGR